MEKLLIIENGLKMGLSFDTIQEAVQALSETTISQVHKFIRNRKALPNVGQIGKITKDDGSPFVTVKELASKLVDIGAQEGIVISEQDALNLANSSLMGAGI